MVNSRPPGGQKKEKKEKTTVSETKAPCSEEVKSRRVGMTLSRREVYCHGRNREVALQNACRHGIRKDHPVGRKKGWEGWKETRERHLR